MHYEERMHRTVQPFVSDDDHVARSSWDELVTPMKEAASTLGYDPESWDRSMRWGDGDETQPAGTTHSVRRHPHPYPYPAAQVRRLRTTFTAWLRLLPSDLH
jgi:hypothetical protein